MKSLLLLLTHLSLFIQLQAQEIDTEFWVIRTDNKTADSLSKSISEKSLSQEVISEKISELIKKEKIEELAKFQEKLSSLESKKMKTHTGDMKVPDVDEVVAMGVDLEAVAALHKDQQKVDARFALTIYEKVKKRRATYSNKTLHTAQTIDGEGWHILHYWRDSQTTTLFLAHFNHTSDKKAQPNHPIAINDVELYEISPHDLIKFNKSTPATRLKALAWLRGRSTLLSQMTLPSRSGERLVSEDQVVSMTRPEAYYSGFVIDLETVIGTKQQEADYIISASWQNRDQLKAEPEYTFKFAKTVPFDQSLIIYPTSQPKDDKKSVIMIMTPGCLRSSAPLQSKITDKDKPILEKKSSRVYAVKPSFLRVLSLGDRRSTKDILTSHGMTFPDGTFVNFMTRSCTIVTILNKEGHLALQKILSEHDLLPE